MTRDEYKYMYNKKHHLCQQCGKQDAYTVGGRTLCYECSIKAKEWKRANKEKRAKKVAMESKERYERLKAQNICTSCGKRPAKQGRVRCEYCLNKNKKAHQKERIKEGKIPVTMLKDLNICAWCKKFPCVDGKRLCSKCYAKSLVTAENMRSYIKHRKETVLGKHTNDNKFD